MNYSEKQSKDFWNKIILNVTKFNLAKICCLLAYLIIGGIIYIPLLGHLTNNSLEVGLSFSCYVVLFITLILLPTVEE